MIRLLTLALLLTQTPTPSTLIQLTDAIPTASPDALRASIPPLLQGIAGPDPQTRSLAMLGLIALTTRDPSTLAPSATLIASHLDDPDLPVRRLTVVVLGNFAPYPPPEVIPALVTALNKPDRTLGQAIIPALLALSIPDHPESAAAILQYLHRPTLPPDTLAKLLATIAHAKSHSPALDAGLLAFLTPANPAPVRAALITALPTLAITPAALTSTRARLTQITHSPQEDPTVKSAAASILPCWHTPAMTAPCPALPVRYRMVPPPIPVPRYKSPPLS